LVGEYLRVFLGDRNEADPVFRTWIHECCGAIRPAKCARTYHTWSPCSASMRRERPRRRRRTCGSRQSAIDCSGRIGGAMPRTRPRW
jgi:hypothetical protein